MSTRNFKPKCVSSIEKGLQKTASHGPRNNQQVRDMWVNTQFF